eukprot:Hpha_TRINITY_DN709_c0_g1::TRINITY_DN709_c0_g1_i1::g.28998::m.28998
MQHARKCWWKCSGWIMRESDTAEDENIKRVLTPMLLCILPVNLYLVHWALDEDVIVYLSAHALFVGGYMFFFAAGALGMNMALTLDVMLVVWTVASTLNDAYNAAALRPRNWTLVVMFLDGALVFGRYRIIPLMILITLSWLLLSSLESAFRFGLYDQIDSSVRAVCDCTNPPCPTSFGGVAGGLMSAYVVLLVDYYLTHGFASDLRLQLRRVNSSVAVAVEIAAALARYDVDSAESAISSGTDLPEELAISFVQLLSNLRPPPFVPRIPGSLMRRGGGCSITSAHITRRNSIPPDLK